MDRLLYIFLQAAFYGLAAQQLLELVYVFVPAGRWELLKKPVSKGFSVAAGAALTAWSPWLPARKGTEIALAGLVAAAFSEASNALIKTLVYAKEVRKARAAQELSATGLLSMTAMGRK